MNLAPITEGDIVKVDIKGRIFLALVEEKADRQLRIKPIDNRITYLHATSHQIKGHWKQRPR